MINIEDKEQEALEKIENFIMAYDNLSSYQDFGEAFYELDKFHKYISKAMREGIIPQWLGTKYKELIKAVYGVDDQKKVSDAIAKMYDMLDSRRNKTSAFNNGVKKAKDLSNQKSSQKYIDQKGNDR